MSFKKLPVPPRGTIINVGRSNVVFKGSNVPCVHLSLEDGKWVALNPSLNYGLIAYITEPSVVFLDHLARIEIFEVAPNKRSVFARAIQEKPSKRRSGSLLSRAPVHTASSMGEAA